VIEVDVALTRGAFRIEAAFAADARIVALFGRSGAGKSSIVNAIAGVVRPDRGRIAVDGRALFDSAKGIDLAPEQRRVGYVFQDALLFPHLTVRGNLGFGERLTPPAERYIDRGRVIELLDLGKLLDRRPANLSGGERQRAAIGRALLASPRVLLMDEPLASLDAARKAEILAYIELLRDEIQLPIVYVSHSLEEVTRLADHVVVVAEGSVAASGSVADTLGRADMAALAGRFEAGAIVDARVVRVDERYGLTTLAFDGGELVVPNLDSLPGERVRARIRARDVSLSLARPEGITIQNILEATVRGVATEYGAIVDVTLSVGGTTLLARVTRKAVDDLALAPGRRVHALVKAVAIDRRSVGFA
jgi:molybdate transport system ATP-binding protein